MVGYIIGIIAGLLLVNFVTKTIKFTFKIVIFLAITVGCVMFLKNFFPNLF